MYSIATGHSEILGVRSLRVQGQHRGLKVVTLCTQKGTYCSLISSNTFAVWCTV